MNDHQDTEVMKIDNNLYTVRPPLSKAEQQDVVRKAQGGDQEALNRLIESAMPFIWRQAQRYGGRVNHVSAEDLLQSAVVGFAEGVMAFDLEKGYRLLTYADHHILKQVMLLLHAESDHGAVSRRDLDALAKLRDAIAVWQQFHPDEEKPSVDDLATMTGAPLYLTKKLIGLAYHPVTSLEQPIALNPDEAVPLADFIPDASPAVEDLALVDSDLQRHLSRLSPIHRLIVEQCLLADPPISPTTFSRRYGTTTAVAIGHLKHAKAILRAHYLREGREAK